MCPPPLSPSSSAHSSCDSSSFFPLLASPFAQTVFSFSFLSFSLSFCLVIEFELADIFESHWSLDQWMKYPFFSYFSIAICARSKSNLLFKWATHDSLGFISVGKEAKFSSLLMRSENTKFCLSCDYWRKWFLPRMRRERMKKEKSKHKDKEKGKKWRITKMG